MDRRAVPQGTAPAAFGLPVVLPSRKMTLLYADDGKITYENSGPVLGYQPLFMHVYGGRGEVWPDGGGIGVASYYTVTPAGQLRNVHVKTQSSKDGVDTVTCRYDAPYGAGWDRSEDLAFGPGVVYRLTADGRLTRYTLGSTGQFGNNVPIFSGAGRVKCITLAGKVADASLGSCDALLATLTTGELREYRIQRTGTRWRAFTLKPAGSRWDGLVQMHASERDGARTIVGQWADNRISLYYQLPNGPVQGYFTKLTLPAGARLLG